MPPYSPSFDLSDCLILIPARYESSRFPGKPLAKIQGKTLIHHVFSRANILEGHGVETWVVTNHPQIEDHVHSFGGRVIRVDDEVSSGTERIFLAYQRHFQTQNQDYKDYKVVLNLQGDAPLISPVLLEHFLSFCLGERGVNRGPCTLLKKRGLDEGFTSPHVVKCAYSQQSQECLYFSRSPIPYGGYEGGDEGKSYFQHIGIYGFSPKDLQNFCLSPPHPLESSEGLEQLRILGHTGKIQAMVVKDELISVDLPSDINKVEGYLRNASKSL